MNLAFLLVALFALILIYFKIADKLNIIDKPNTRSSHSYITIRGGGIIFWLAGTLFILFHRFNSAWFLTGFTLISFISFWDDIRSLPSPIRFSVHLIAVSLAFYDLKVFELLNVWQIIFSYFLFVGIINAYNFMDGINGITGLYSLSILFPLIYINEQVVNFTNTDFILYAVSALLVFLFFNYRKKAKCFAGDIGSVSIAFWITFLLLQLIIKTNDIKWLLLLIVYGVDTACTITHRLCLRQNIFQPHRLHFYQILVNEKGFDHRFISLIYALVQGLIATAVIMLHNLPMVILYLLCILPLFIIYVLKFKLMSKT